MSMCLKKGHQPAEKGALRFPTGEPGLRPRGKDTKHWVAGSSEALQTPGLGGSGLPVSAHGDFVGLWLPCAFCRSLGHKCTF